ncbi:MAG: universal stress protein [Bacteroidetes bacterium]|nr:universal stress protein [Bacteroidota bacterium]
MRTILVPVDFSEAAENAFRYALKLVRISHSRIVLLYVVHPEDTLNEVEENDIETRLLNLCLKIAHASGSESSFVIKHGGFSEMVLETARERHAELILIGQSKYKTFAKMLFGSSAVNVLSEVKVPVLIVPETVAFRIPKMVTYATTYKMSDVAAIRYLVELLGPFGAQINLLHVSSGKSDPATDRSDMKEFMEKVTATVDYSNLSFQIQSSDAPVKTIVDYSGSGSADMIVLSTHLDEGAWGRLFDTSLAREVSEKEIPLLAFHHKENSSVKLF